MGAEATAWQIQETGAEGGAAGAGLGGGAGEL